MNITAQLSSTVHIRSFEQTNTFIQNHPTHYHYYYHSFTQTNQLQHSFKMQFTTIFAATLFAAATVISHPLPDFNPIHLRSLHHARSGHTSDIFAPFAGHATKMARSFLG